MQSYNEVIVLNTSYTIKDTSYPAGSVLFIDDINYELASDLVDKKIAFYDVID